MRSTSNWNEFALPVLNEAAEEGRQSLGGSLGSPIHPERGGNAAAVDACARTRGLLRAASLQPDTDDPRPARTGRAGGLAHEQAPGLLRETGCARAQNPRVLGIGIDEDTAIVVRGSRFRVIGGGAVYLVDASDMTRSDAETAAALSIYDFRLHVLSSGDAFDLATRRPEVA